MAGTYSRQLTIYINGQAVRNNNVFSNFLPALSFGAIAAGAATVFNKITSATDALGTKWETFTGGLKSGLNEFWRSIADGNWSNLIGKMKDAIEVGRNYIQTLDYLEEKKQAEKNTAFNTVNQNKQPKQAENCIIYPVFLLFFQRILIGCVRHILALKHIIYRDANPFEWSNCNVKYL